MDSLANHQLLFKACGVVALHAMTPKVFTCKHPHYGDVVVKIAQTTAEKIALMREAKFLTNYTSNYWPAIWDSGSLNQTDWLLLERFSGVHINKLSWQTSLNPIAINVEVALQHLHLTGMIHGDIKPSNIIVTSEHEVRLIDFGSVLPIGSRYQIHTSTSITPKYSSPNAKLRLGVVSSKDDYYALARSIIDTQLNQQAHSRQGVSAKYYLIT